MSCDLTVLAGTQPAVEATFRDADGVLTDPSAITVTTKSPSGALLEYIHPGAPEIVKNVTDEPIGVWRYTFPGAVTEAGKWWIQFAGTAGVVAVGEGSVSVKKTKVV
jgi:hypothetical protein